MTHDIQHYATSDAWEPPEPNIQTSCTVTADDTVVIRNPAIPGGEIAAECVWSLNFSR